MSWIAKLRPLSAVAILIGIIVAIEIAVRLLPVYDYAGPQEYYLHKKGQELKSDTINYEVLLLGDSRSMAIRTPYQGASFYNASLPALGNRYYKPTLKRYLESGRKPKVVVLAVHPHYLLSEGSRPIKGLEYQESASFTEAIQQLINERLARPLFEVQTKQRYSATAELISGFFQEAALHYLGYFDSITVYNGFDQVVQSYESIPYLYQTYFLRLPIRTMINNFTPTQLPGKCETCQEIYSPICASLTPRQKTILAKQKMKDYGGSFNLDDLTSSSSRFGLLLTRNGAIGDLEKVFSNQSSQIDTVQLNELVEYTIQNDIQFIFIELPQPERVAKTINVIRYRQAIQTVLSNYSNTTYIQLPNLSYSEDLFIDPLHLSCFGADKLNQDWQNIYPQIIGLIHQ